MALPSVRIVVKYAEVFGGTIFFLFFPILTNFKSFLETASVISEESKVEVVLGEI